MCFYSRACAHLLRPAFSLTALLDWMMNLFLNPHPFFFLVYLLILRECMFKQPPNKEFVRGKFSEPFYV